MPAYRSSAEAEIRDAVVARIRENRPGARIIHEINVSAYGPNRIDVLAVDTAEIIAVEIKSEKDKLDRLPAQIKSMQGCAHHVIAAIHEKFLVEKPTNSVDAHYERDGQFFMKTLPEGLDAFDAWVYPERRRAMKSVVEGGWDSLATWRFPSLTIQQPLPWQALNLLWRDELEWLCGKLRVSTGRRANMGFMAAALRWQCSGRELTLGICEALRHRQCIEADPVEEVA